MMINYNYGDNGFIFCYRPILIVIYRGDSSKSNVKYSVNIYIDNLAEIHNQFRTCKEARRFVIEILHAFGYHSLNYDIFLHPEEYLG